MPTLNELIKDHTPQELPNYLDKAQLYIIKLLRHEPDYLEEVIPVYEYMNLLKQAFTKEYEHNGNHRN